MSMQKGVLTFRQSFFSLSPEGKLFFWAYLAHLVACLLLDCAHLSRAADCSSSQLIRKPYASREGAGDIQNADFCHSCLLSTLAITESASPVAVQHDGLQTLSKGGSTSKAASSCTSAKCPQGRGHKILVGH